MVHFLGVKIGHLVQGNLFSSPTPVEAEIPIIAACLCLDLGCSRPVFRLGPLEIFSFPYTLLSCPSLFFCFLTSNMSFLLSLSVFYQSLLCFGKRTDVSKHLTSRHFYWQSIYYFYNRGKNVSFQEKKICLKFPLSLNKFCFSLFY